MYDPHGSFTNLLLLLFSKAEDGLSSYTNPNWNEYKYMK